MKLKNERKNNQQLNEVCMYSLNKTKFLEPLELDALTRTLKTDRDGLLISLALATGSRASELLNLTVSDLSDSNQSVFIRGLKNSNDREIPLKLELYSAIRNMSPRAPHGTLARPLDERIFPISYSRLVQIWHFYRPVKKGFKSLRHTFALELYRKTRDLRIVQTAMGHKGINNTMIYQSYVYSIDEMRKAML